MKRNKKGSIILFIIGLFLILFGIIYMLFFSDFRFYRKTYQDFSIQCQYRVSKDKMTSVKCDVQNRIDKKMTIHDMSFILYAEKTNSFYELGFAEEETFQAKEKKTYEFAIDLKDEINRIEMHYDEKES